MELIPTELVCCDFRNSMGRDRLVLVMAKFYKSSLVTVNSVKMFRGDYVLISTSKNVIWRHGHELNKHRQMEKVGG